MKSRAKAVIADRLVRFVLFNWILGAMAGALCATIVLVLDLGHLRSLLERSDVMLPGLLLLFGGFMVTFGGVVCGAALMQISGKPDGDGL